MSQTTTELADCQYCKTLFDPDWLCPCCGNIGTADDYEVVESWTEHRGNGYDEDEYDGSSRDVWLCLVCQQTFEGE